MLGGETVVGENTIIGGNTFITESIPANTKVSAKSPELVIKNRRPRFLPQMYGSIDKNPINKKV